MLPPQCFQSWTLAWKDECLLFTEWGEAPDCTTFISPQVECEYLGDSTGY